MLHIVKSSKVCPSATESLAMEARREFLERSRLNWERNLALVWSAKHAVSLRMMLNGFWGTWLALKALPHPQISCFLSSMCYNKEPLCSVTARSPHLKEKGQWAGGSSEKSSWAQIFESGPLDRKVVDLGCVQNWESQHFGNGAWKTSLFGDYSFQNPPTSRAS